MRVNTTESNVEWIRTLENFDTITSYKFNYPKKKKTRKGKKEKKKKDKFDAPWVAFYFILHILSILILNLIT